MNKISLVVIAILCTYTINAMDSHIKLHNAALDALAVAVEVHVEKDDSQSTINALRCFSQDIKLRLGVHLCPFIIRNPENPHESLHLYIGHFAVRTRDLELFKSYLDHVDNLDMLDITDNSGLTILELIIDEMKTGHESDILYDMLVELNQLDPSQKITVPADIPPQTTIIGFNTKS